MGHPPMSSRGTMDELQPAANGGILSGSPVEGIVGCYELIDSQMQVHDVPVSLRILEAMGMEQKSEEGNLCRSPAWGKIAVEVLEELEACVEIQETLESE